MGRGDQNNNEQNTTLKKITNNIVYLFCGEANIDPVINRSITFNTYMQIGQMVRIIVLYTLFSSTNNAIYHGIQAALSGLIFVICFIPRLSNKHYALLLTFICFLLFTVAAAATVALLLQNFFTFKNYCNLLQAYKQKNQSFEFTAEQLCKRVISLYHLNFTTEGLVTILRIVYLYMNLKAYRVVKRIYNEEQKRRRRKQKFDQNMKHKNYYDPNRKI